MASSIKAQVGCPECGATIEVQFSDDDTAALFLKGSLDIVDNVGRLLRGRISVLASHKGAHGRQQEMAIDELSVVQSSLDNLARRLRDRILEAGGVP